MDGKVYVDRTTPPPPTVHRAPPLKKDSKETNNPTDYITSVVLFVVVSHYSHSPIPTAILGFMVSSSFHFHTNSLIYRPSHRKGQSLEKILKFFNCLKMVFKASRVY